MDLFTATGFSLECWLLSLLQSSLRIIRTADEENLFNTERRGAHVQGAEKKGL
jgi:hypothetical protein